MKPAVAAAGSSCLEVAAIAACCACRHNKCCSYRLPDPEGSQRSGEFFKWQCQQQLPQQAFHLSAMPCAKSGSNKPSILQTCEHLSSCFYLICSGVQGQSCAAGLRACKARAPPLQGRTALMGDLEHLVCTHQAHQWSGSDRSATGC